MACAFFIIPMKSMGVSPRSQIVVDKRARNRRSRRRRRLAARRGRRRGGIGGADLDDAGALEPLEHLAHQRVRAAPLVRSASRLAAVSRSVGAVAPWTSATIHRSPVQSARRLASVWASAGEAPSTSDTVMRPGSNRSSRTSCSSAWTSWMSRCARASATTSSKRASFIAGAGAGAARRARRGAACGPRRRRGPRAGRPVGSGGGRGAARPRVASASLRSASSGVGRSVA